MAQSIRATWFGRNVVVWLSTGKSVSGTISEATDTYLILEDQNGVETQVMVHAILAIKLADQQSEQSGGV
mgnify:CR=1 FL=1